MRRIAIVLMLATMMLTLSLPGLAQDVVELRMTWYTDGNEDVVMRDLLDRFEMENSDIRVVMDNVPYQAGILETLPIQLAAGEGPDMARVTDLGGLAEFYLDMTPLLSDADYWLDSFGGTLGWLRMSGAEGGIHGFPTQLTITGPIINRTLFEQAGVEVPSDMTDQVTWEEWAAAANEVADALDIPFPMAMDRSGHRFAGPAISMGAKYFDDDGSSADRWRRGLPRHGRALRQLASRRHHAARNLGGQHWLRRRQRGVRQQPGRLLHVRQLAGWPVHGADR